MVLLLKELSLEDLQHNNMPYKDPNDPRKVAYMKAWYKANMEHVCARTIEYQRQNPEKTKARKKLWYEVNKERELLKSAERYLNNFEKISARKKAYRSANKPLFNAMSAKRRAYQRSPAWLTDFDKLKIKCIYSIASMLSHENKEAWHVDHIIPLQGKEVCGLHVPNNLWFVRAEENLSKGNKLLGIRK